MNFIYRIYEVSEDIGRSDILLQQEVMIVQKYMHMITQKYMLLTILK